MCAIVCGGFSPSIIMWAAGAEHRRLGLVAATFTSQTISPVLGGGGILYKTSVTLTPKLDESFRETFLNISTWVWVCTCEHSCPQRPEV